MICYTRNEILLLSSTCESKILNDFCCKTLIENGIFRNGNEPIIWQGKGVIKNRRRHRGRRGGRKMRKTIDTLITHRSVRLNKSKSVNQSNLIPISTSANINKINNNKVTKYQFPTFLFTNPCSICNKMEDLQVTLEHNNIQVCTLAETWFNGDYICKVSNYNIFYKSRTNTRGGGVATYVHNSIPSDHVDFITVPDELECVWVKLQPYKLPREVSEIYVCTIYCSPSQNKDHQRDLLNHLRNSIDTIRSRRNLAKVIIAGDFNSVDISSLIKHVVDLHQVVKDKTRGDKILDLIISDLKDFYMTPTIQAPLGKSDHNVIIWKPLNSIKCNDKMVTKIFKPCTDSSMRSFGNWITKFDWSQVYNIKDVDDKVNIMNDTLTSAYNKFFPTKHLRVYSTDRPWITPYIKKLIRYRQTAFRKKKHERYKTLRNKVIWEIKKAKEKYYRYKVKMLEVSNPRKWYDKVKQICGKRKDKPRITFDNPLPIPDSVASKQINEHLAKICRELDPLKLDELPTYLPAESPPPQILCFEVKQQLLKVQINKSVPPGEIPPVTKKGTVSIEQIRPISLTPLFIRIFEHFLTKWLNEDLSTIIDKQQFGNVKGISTSHYLIGLLHYLLSGLEKPGHKARILAVDFSKAFDRISHQVLISKMISIGVRKSIIPWFCSFLTCREQRVLYGSAISSWTSIFCGVPQGTKFGPSLFQVMVNDSASDCITRWKFVDDLTFADISKNNCQDSIQSYFSNLEEWCKINNMSLNPNKCKSVEINFCKTPGYYDLLTNNGVQVETVKQLKLLGVTIQDNLKWDTHIGEIVSKANKAMHIVSVLKRFGAPEDQLIKIYKSFIRPIIEYACPTWHSSLTSELSFDLESVQKRFLRILLGRRYYSYTAALKKFSLDRLCDRRLQLVLKFGRSVHEKFSNIIPNTRAEATGRSLRNANKISQIKCRTERFKKSTLPFLINNDLIVQ
ncbi:uncharacterized protein [Antedon mediterranea]|uniref:uncharacterized protein n=1 Tax=Antedon mediterranea TaxID=105859 RepID=UPI003AF9D59C